MANEMKRDGRGGGSPTRMSAAANYEVDAALTRRAGSPAAWNTAVPDPEHAEGPEYQEKDRGTMLTQPHLRDPPRPFWSRAVPDVAAALSPRSLVAASAGKTGPLGDERRGSLMIRAGSMVTESPIEVPL